MEQSMDIEGTEGSLSGVEESVKVKVFRSGDSDSTDSGNSTKGAPNESCTSAADMLSPSPNEKSDLYFCRSSLKELRNLPTNKWNNGNAHKVLGAFRVKRYRIDPDYVLCPTGRGLLVSDRLKLHSDSWNQIQPKIDRLTDVFKGDTHLISDIYDDCADEETKVKCFQMALSRLERNIAAIQKESFFEYQFSKVERCWHEYLLNHITENLEKQFLAGKILQEYCYEDYFHYLIRLLTKIADLDICLKKTISRADFSIPSSDKAQTVKPDFFLVKDLQEGLLAVVKVKTHTWASHRGHRVPSCKHPLPEDDKGAAANVNEEAIEEEDQENEDDKKKNEAYEQQESDIEESQKHLLPKYLRSLPFGLIEPFCNLMFSFYNVLFNPTGMEMEFQDLFERLFRCIAACLGEDIMIQCRATMDGSQLDKLKLPLPSDKLDRHLLISSIPDLFIFERISVASKRGIAVVEVKGKKGDKVIHSDDEDEDSGSLASVDEESEESEEELSIVEKVKHKKHGDMAKLKKKMRRYVRKFLPQLMGEMLCLNETKGIVRMKEEEPGFSFGVAMVGFDVHFVSLVRSDGESIRYTFHQNEVFTHVFITRALDIRNRTDRRIVFKTLAAACYVQKPMLLPNDIPSGLEISSLRL